MNQASAIKADRVPGLRAELKVGQPCPVCDRTITRLIAQRLGILRRQ